MNVCRHIMNPVRSLSSPPPGVYAYNTHYASAYCSGTCTLMDWNPKPYMYVCAVKDDFKFAFAWELWHLDGHVLLAGRNQDVSQDAYTALPFLSRIVNYQLLREDLIGGNKGGVEIVVRSEETRVRKWVIYWTGYKQIRDESSSSALKSISIQCDTIRTHTIPSLRDALARLARQMFAGSSDERLQYRTLFGKLRLEASVHDPYYCSAFSSLRQDLSPAYADMFEEDELKRTRAIVKFLSDHCLQV